MIYQYVPDAIEASVNFLRANAKDGDGLYSNFDMLPLMFYLPDLKYVYSIDPARLVIPKEPPLPAYITSVNGADWYIWRDVRMGLGPFLTNDEFIEKMKKERRRLIPNDLKISSLYWDVNWPQKYQTYIDRMLWKETAGFGDVVVYEIK